MRSCIEVATVLDTGWGTAISKADLASALMIVITDCKNGPKDGYMCPFVVGHEGQSWHDSKA